MPRPTWTQASPETQSARAVKFRSQTRRRRPPNAPHSFIFACSSIEARSPLAGKLFSINIGFMKKAPILTALFATAIAVAGVFAYQSNADATLIPEAPVAASVEQTAEPAEEAPNYGCQGAEEFDFEAKRCSTSSDCPNSKCRKSRCGGCSTSSDCRYGKCKSSQCGGCSTSSDCKGWGKCSKSRCGSCSTSSDCGRFGKCRSGKCTKTPY